MPLTLRRCDWFFTEATMNQANRQDSRTNGIHTFVFTSLLVLGTLLLGGRAEATVTISSTNRANFKLLAMVQKPTVENPANVFHYDIDQYKVTNKEMLQILSVKYPSANLPGTRLTIVDGGEGFVLVFPSGSTQLVGELTWGPGPVAAAEGINNTLQGTLRQRMFGAIGLNMLLNANYQFALVGGGTVTRNKKGAEEARAARLKLFGPGKLNGRAAYLTGAVSGQYQD